MALQRSPSTRDRAVLRLREAGGQGRYEHTKVGRHFHYSFIICSLVLLSPLSTYRLKQNANTTHRLIELGDID